ncbi:DUF1206 domain-containing protein [Luteimicrobium xylanilyticum]|uniref:DUF1206 domain-containing protein n=1 Tax=Luteimicrobium xylanilyticum TaxID=1133546 RepID=A0A5P9Q8E9_9MICO|nr:DUF1206 domain-containing protein [Luteimicrobium xylanilyticum]QFU97400.1 uncharacterized protein KDY119_00898 [Luteimicrobium xylanilyticum]
MPTSTTTSPARAARGAASSVRDSAALRAGARIGFAAAGLVHILLGVVALRVAFGGSGSADPAGALATLQDEPGGPLLLWVVLVALVLLGLFLLLEGALLRGTDRDAWAKRGKKLATGIAYLAVAATAFGVVHSHRSSSKGTTRTWSARLLDAPGGRVLLFVVALVVLGVATYFVVKGVKAKFRDDIRVPAGSLGSVVMVLGRTGYVAKGVALGVVAVLTGAAALTADASKSGGLDSALKSLVALPAGVVLLAVVAVGLIAYGVYFFARAKYARL